MHGYKQVFPLVKLKSPTWHKASRPFMVTISACPSLLCLLSPSLYPVLSPGIGRWQVCCSVHQWRLWACQPALVLWPSAAPRRHQRSVSFLTNSRVKSPGMHIFCLGVWILKLVLNGCQTSCKPAVKTKKLEPHMENPMLHLCKWNVKVPVG